MHCYEFYCREKETNGIVERLTSTKVLIRVSFEALMDRRFSREGGRAFQVDDLENARVLLYRLCGDVVE